MSYVDGFVAAVPNSNKQAYIAHCQSLAPLFKANGALQYVECWGDDVPDGELTSMPMAVKCQADETVIFAWVVWPSKEVRDSGMKAVMDAYDAEANPMPFDGKRIIFGSFESVVYQI